ncbi:MAG: hypothetical protein HUU38_32535 [Anaerolineales bacterium]|nr:hypothetical protein [Anaerolineales bacterium]
MTYTTTLKNGKLILPDDVLKMAGLTRDESVRIESTPEGLVVRKVASSILVTEAERRFPEEWIFMAVTQTDEYGMALGGAIIAHAPDPTKVQEIAKNWIQKNPGKSNYFFYSGVPEADVVI